MSRRTDHTPPRQTEHVEAMAELIRLMLTEGGYATSVPDFPELGETQKSPPGAQGAGPQKA